MENFLIIRLYIEGIVMCKYNLGNHLYFKNSALKPAVSYAMIGRFYYILSDI